MQREQLPLVEPEPQPSTPVCAWCLEPASTEFEVAPPQYGLSRGIRVVRKPALMVPVCRACARRLEEGLGG